MRTIENTKAFKRDQKRVDKSNVRNVIKKRFAEALTALTNDIPLDYSYHDHQLLGNWLGSRECHLAFDFVLVYTLEGDDKLILERLGTHTETLGL